MTRKRIIILFLSALTASLHAQDQPEYLMEIGAGGGVVNYLGDFNGSLVKNFQPAATVVARYNFNSYMGMKLALGYGKMKGTSVFRRDSA